MRRTALTLVLALACASAFADEGARNGEKLYRVYCTQCHGLQGNGKGINAAHLSVQPRDHTDTAEMSARTDDDLFKAIKEGGKAVNKSVLMPSWKANLSDEDVRALVAYLRELCCRK
ncbi:MAG: cytochrome c [Pseudomonadota bacterium]|jgi:Cytochrome c553|nr:MAG: cytochrome C [Pseudomonadota bacterium]